MLRHHEACHTPTAPALDPKEPGVKLGTPWLSTFDWSLVLRLAAFFSFGSAGETRRLGTGSFLMKGPMHVSSTPFHAYIPRLLEQRAGLRKVGA